MSDEGKYVLKQTAYKVQESIDAASRTATKELDGLMSSTHVQELGRLPELLRGRNESSSAYTDPFISLGELANWQELSNTLNTLYEKKYMGRCRATVAGMNVEIYQFVQNFENKTFSQVVLGNVAPSEDGTQVVIKTVEHFDILARYCINEVWSAWESVSKQNIPVATPTADGLMSAADKRAVDNMPRPQDTASATAASRRYVYSVDNPDAKNSVLNAPDTLIKQVNGQLMFQKGLWNPLGQAIYYTRGRIPLATAGADGALSKEVFARLGGGGTIREYQPTTKKVPIAYPDWAAGGTRTFELLPATSARAGVMTAADKSELDRLVQASAQFTVAGEYCRATDGAMVADAGYCRSAFVPVDRTAAFSMTGGGASPAAKVAFFDADLRFISAIPYGSSSTPAYPDGAAWFVCSTRVAALSGSKYSPTAGSEATTGAAAALMAGKVDKVEGKGLSANDYTDDDKQKVDNLNNITPISVGFFEGEHRGTDYTSVLRVYGHEKLVEQGYVPVIFRRKKCERHYRKYDYSQTPAQKLYSVHNSKKGWICYGSPKSVKIENGVMMFTTENGDGMKDLPMENPRYSQHPLGSLIRTYEDGAGKFVLWSRRVPLKNNNGEYRNLKFDFGLGFIRKDKPYNEAITLSDLVSTLAEFTVIVQHDNKSDSITVTYGQ